MSTSVSGRKCSNCAAQLPLQSVSVRLYLRRAQWDYRYDVCAECLRVLKSLLWCGASNASRGMFDPPAAVERQARVRA